MNEFSNRFDVLGQQKFHGLGIELLSILRDRYTGVLYLYSLESGLTVMVDRNGKPLIY